MNKKEEVIRWTFIQSKETEYNYFYSSFLLRKRGPEKNLSIDKIPPFEEKMIAEAIPKLKAFINIC